MGNGQPPMMSFPPHMMPPPHMRGYPMFMPPFSPFGPMPHMHRSPAAGSGPIITESVYDTYPRGNGRNGTTYEEPIYMPSNNSPAMPPHASYKPGSMSPEHYEGYYDSHGQHPAHRGHAKKHTHSGSDSDVSGEGSNQFWEAYEAGAYRRKAHINEKAFANTAAGTIPHQNGADTTPKAKHNGDEKSGMKARPNGDTHKMDFIRPDTPPADYDNEHNNNISNRPIKKDSNLAHQNGQAVY